MEQHAGFSSLKDMGSCTMYSSCGMSSIYNLISDRKSIACAVSIACSDGPYSVDLVQSLLRDGVNYSAMVF